jgi:hypothetical protein
VCLAALKSYEFSLKIVLLLRNCLYNTSRKEFPHKDGRMPVDIQLLRDNRLAIHTWVDPVTNEDFAKAFQTLAPWYEQGTLPVHSVYIALQVTRLPPRAISTYIRTPTSPLVHPNSGLLIVVATNQFVRVMVETAARLSPKGKLQLARTVEEAVDRIDRLLQEQAAVSGSHT